MCSGRGGLSLAIYSRQLLVSEGGFPSAIYSNQLVRERQKGQRATKKRTTKLASSRLWHRHESETEVRVTKVSFIVMLQICLIRVSGHLFPLVSVLA